MPSKKPPKPRPEQTEAKKASTYSPANASTVTNILRRYADWLDNQDAECNSAHAASLNEYLNGLLSQDAFGTEGQCDPRGDHRD